jgi:hypothetical protein
MVIMCYFFHCDNQSILENNIKGGIIYLDSQFHGMEDMAEHSSSYHSSQKQGKVHTERARPPSTYCLQLGPTSYLSLPLNNATILSDQTRN